MSFNAKDMTQGGQIASMRIRMFSQIANIMLYCLFIFFWILVGLIVTGSFKPSGLFPPALQK
ncbi:hypothetical protein QSI67_25025 [Escherichia coli]|uniref:hypothetical protein n=2 Tax=Escherichia coli TaxID=562 RepID=UPI0023F9895E|nr:hypothetical protein [Escherichia coli]MDF6700891.1 hypothetical protein [Escherichia coli]MDK2418589.1 hypothetical protein [Escherichia coli]MDS2002637.1 hypothetical protein [Escherichia coli]MDS2007859.1 hypothetical protein [Escherichia coli]MDS2013075.1 hypothetical protein [Escherichia coli]